jgi:hypothetical protein
MPATAGKLCNGQAFKPGTQEIQSWIGWKARPLLRIRYGSPSRWQRAQLNALGDNAFHLPVFLAS